LTNREIGMKRGTRRQTILVYNSSYSYIPARKI
jgi:hypothetical protein